MEAVHVYRRKQLETHQWTTWLNTVVYLNEHDFKSTMKRQEALTIFVKEGLVPFLESRGYVFSPQYHIVSHLATYLFKRYSRDFVKQPFERIYNHVNVDLLHYEDSAVPPDDWDYFWKQWGLMTDFYDDQFRNRFWIPYFCYNRLDLLHSDATNKVDKELEEDYPEDDVQLNEDLVRVKDKKGMY